MIDAFVLIRKPGPNSQPLCKYNSFIDNPFLARIFVIIAPYAFNDIFSYPLALTFLFFVTL